MEIVKRIRQQGAEHMNTKHTATRDINNNLEETLEKVAGYSQNNKNAHQDNQVRLTEDDTGHRVLIYSTDHGINIELRFQGETFWATQNQMSEMFGVKIPAISKHLRNIIEEGELLEDSVVSKMEITAADGKRYQTKLYNLNAIISVGYRVSSKQGTMFRIWATDKLFQILTKGFYIDRERLKTSEQPSIIDEFREIAREIRTSTQNMYREVKRLCTLCQDYDGASQDAREFFMSMENKLLYASANMTAPEIILQRADASQKDMGLTCFAGKRGPTRSDIKIANNYLAEGEARTKNRITDLWLTYVEDQLDQGKLVTMEEVREKLDRFVQFNEWPLLKGVGRVTREAADTHAIAQHDLYKKALFNE